MRLIPNTIDISKTTLALNIDVKLMEEINIKNPILTLYYTFILYFNI